MQNKETYNTINDLIMHDVTTAVIYIHRKALIPLPSNNQKMNREVV